MFVADKLRALKLRELKAWKVIDAYLAQGKSKEKISAQVRLEAACFILKRLYPEKLTVGGTGTDGEIVIKVIKADPEENGDQLQTPRFTVSSLQ